MRNLWPCTVVAGLTLAFLAIGCSPDRVDPPTTPTKVSVDREHLRDAYGRYVYLNGINVSGTTKVPVTTDPVSYIGRPFPLEEADQWMAKLKADGFNSMRLLTIWEAVNHEGPGIYDEAYLDYFEEIVKLANKHGIYVLINFHENMFSRHFYAKFNESPELGKPGSLEHMLSAVFPAKNPDTDELYYDGRVAGDGAPRWAVEACAPEKDLDHPSYGMLRILGPLGKSENVNKVISGFTSLLGGGEDTGEDDSSTDALIEFLGSQLILLGANDLVPFEVNETCDMMPWTFWGINVALSVDVEKCYGAFYAGDKLFPDRTIGGKNLKDYLQDGFVGSWVEVAKRVKKYPNVIGYDLMNEPPGVFIILSVLSAYLSADFDTSAAKSALVELIGREKGDAIFDIIEGLEVLPMLPGVLNKDAMETNLNEPLKDLAAAAVKDAFMVLSKDLPVDDLAAEPFATATATELARVTSAALAQTGYYYDQFDGIDSATLDAAMQTAIDAGLEAALTYANTALNALAAPDAIDQVDIVMTARDKGAAAVADALDQPLAEARSLLVTAYWNDIKAKWGLDGMDLFTALGMNLSLERDYLMPLYIRAGKAILAEDPSAVFWLESGGTVTSLLSSGGLPWMSASLYKPDELPQVVFSPHWYPDIYPTFGFKMSPRTFVPQEWKTKDFTASLQGKLDAGLSTLGPVPMVFGEFGTYFNYNWDLNDREMILNDIAQNDYAISKEILNNYYESFDELFLDRIVWCFSADNDYRLGDLWDHEDFSFYDPQGQPRAEEGWMRPVPRFLAGEPKAMHFNSALHWFDPDKGEPEEWQRGEFYVSYEGKETGAPTEIYIPDVQYPDGFYVWLSDGWALYDHSRQTLYHYPTNDDPQWTHEVTVRPPAAAGYKTDWSYFFKGDQSLTGNRH